MHTSSDEVANPHRTTNLMGALALEATHAMEQATQDVVGQAGAAAAALVLIPARPEWTIEQLRAPLGLSQPGATRLVARLEDAGWVERLGPGGRRGVRLRLTAEGERVFDRLLLARRAAVSELLAPLSERERDQLTGLLEKLLAARTQDRPTLERICRLCERRCCERCPVAHAYETGAVTPRSPRGRGARRARRPS
jgi:MarR family transcriptional regulator, negative regulator of the multidrug operon emrRAB